jgi:alkanesulfonate monooxygenase SsuD/methylene tetrahydromethanopterin reductase-like flavin-dependent oxidoreductase (luciferase family)
MLRPYRDHIPLYLAAVGPRNLELTGEVADGWLGVFFAPEHAAASMSPLQLGAARAGRDISALDTTVTVPVVVGDDVARCAEAVKPYTALYVGGMGSRTQNFYHALAVRMGFADAAERIQDHYLDRRPREAAAAVPFELVDQTALVGPRERIAERLHAYAEAGVTDAQRRSARRQRRAALRGDERGRGGDGRRRVGLIRRPEDTEAAVPATATRTS